MRKILSILLVSSALFSCSMEEVINAPELQPISFGNMFIENSTRAIYNKKEDLQQFYVYGNVKGNQDNTVNLYGDGAMVYRNTASAESGDGIWKCDVTQYWVPDCTYQFAAVSNAKDDGVTVKTNNNGLPETIEYDVSSQKDLLYASVSDVKTSAMGTPSGTGIEINTVAFTFNHLLSKVKFVFTNGFAEANDVNLTVTNIAITDATKNGSYSIQSGVWSPQQSNCKLEFGETEEMGKGDTVESEERLLIPGNKELNITLQVKHNKGSQTPVNVGIKFAPNLEKGCSYNFTAELNAQNITGIAPITFNISKSGWENNVERPVGPLYPAESE